MLQNWLKVAFANFRRNILSTIINILGIALGLTGFILTVLWWNHEKSYEQWNPYKNEVCYVNPYFDGEWGMSSNIPLVMAVEAKNSFSEIEDYYLIRSWGESALFKIDGKNIYQEEGVYGVGNFFSFFPFEKVAGSYADITKDDIGIAISEEFSKKLFGNNSCIGKQLSTDRKTFIIRAVYKLPKKQEKILPQYVYSESKEEVIKRQNQWGNLTYRGLFKLKKGTNVELLRKKTLQLIIDKRLKNIAQKNGISLKEAISKFGPSNIYLTPMREWNLNSPLKGEVFIMPTADRKSIYTFLLLSILILILSIFNYVNLNIAHGIRRAKEVGLRKSIGSTRGKLIRQFMLETFLIFIGAFAVVAITIYFLFPSYSKILKNDITLNQPASWIYIIIINLLVIVISGIIPALYISKFKPIEVLKGNYTRTKKGYWLRNSLLVVQMVISAFFITSGIVIYLQVQHLLNRDLGFNGQQVLRIYRQAPHKAAYQLYETVQQELKKMPGVVDVSYGELTPGGGSVNSSNLDYNDKQIMPCHASMDYNFPEMLHLKLLAGRSISPLYASDTINNCLLNEAAIKGLGWNVKDAIGKQVQPGFDSLKYTVIGVFKDYNQWNATEDVNPAIFFHYKMTTFKRKFMRSFLVKINPENMEGTINRIQKYWETKVEPGYPFAARFVDKQFAKTFDKYKNQQKIFFILTGIVLLVALLGLFALSSFLIQQQLRDVAIRKTLGASTKSQLKRLTKSYIWMSVIGVITAIPCAFYFTNKWLSGFAYRIDMPWWPYLLSFILLLALTFAVVSIKARAATKVKVIKWLKYE